MVKKVVGKLENLGDLLVLQGTTKSTRKKSQGLKFPRNKREPLPIIVVL